MFDSALPVDLFATMVPFGHPHFEDLAQTKFAFQIVNVNFKQFWASPLLSQQSQ